MFFNLHIHWCILHTSHSAENKTMPQDKNRSGFWSIKPAPNLLVFWGSLFVILHVGVRIRVSIHKTFLTVFLRNFLRTKFKKILRNYFFGIHNPFFMIFVKFKNFLSLFDAEMPNNNFFSDQVGQNSLHW